MKRICLVGQFPPPIHGLSKALQTIIDSKYLKEKFALSFVDITDNKKFANHLGKMEQIEADVYYFTISHSKFGNLRDMFILWWLLRKKKKVIIHYHGGYYKKLYKQLNPLQRLMNKKLISRIDVMIVLSKGLKDLFDDVLNPQKIRICENCIEDEALLSEQEFKQKLTLLKAGKDHLEILYLSNFIKTKGYLELLHAAKALRNEKVVFHFAGKFFNETDKAEFFYYVKQNGLEDCTHYHGIVSGEAKKNLLARSDVFALPTYYPNEGQPISIIEAMGNGLTIVSTSHAGIPDIVSSDNGYLVKPKSPEEIVSVLRELLDDNRRLIDFANENRRVTLTKFKEIDYIKRLEVIMDEV